MQIFLNLSPLLRHTRCLPFIILQMCVVPHTVLAYICCPPSGGTGGGSATLASPPARVSPRRPVTTERQNPSFDIQQVGEGVVFLATCQMGLHPYPAVDAVPCGPRHPVLPRPPNHVTSLRATLALLTCLRTNFSVLSSSE